MFRTLMTARRFAPLFWCQFFSAFNDNFLKNALAFLILFGIGGQADAHAGVLVTLASAVFIGPFFILSGLGGQWADRYDKALMARRLKFAEIFAAGTAVLGFLLHSIPVLFVALGLFGTIAALFGPIKYGILPDHLRREELPAGNALVEAATFLAILLGTIAAGAASAMGGSGLLFGALPAAHHLLLGHGLAVAALRARASGQVGTATNHVPVWPLAHDEADVAAAGFLDLLWNRPLCGIQFLPARFKASQILFSLVNARPGPIAHSAGPLDPIDIVG